jgi:hypothetical protein
MILPVGATFSSPLTGPATISGTSVLYFISSGNITLPRATQAGQQLYLIATSLSSSWTLYTSGGDGLYAGYWNVYLNGATSWSPTGDFVSVVLVSSGTGRWFVVAVN